MSKLITDLQIKATDKHQNLRYTAAQPTHTKCSTIYSHALRMSNTSSDKTDFEKYGIMVPDKMVPI